jgi:uncharacterized Zn finger protein (UPF0148 family)
MHQYEGWQVAPFRNKPEQLQEKIHQLEQQVQKGLDEAAQEQTGLAVAELLDVEKEVEAMKDEVEEASNKMSELTDCGKSRGESLTP